MAIFDVVVIFAAAVAVAVVVVVLFAVEDAAQNRNAAKHFYRSSIILHFNQGQIFITIRIEIMTYIQIS